MKALDEFEAGYWGLRYPAIALSWRRNWDHVVAFFAFPESVPDHLYDQRYRGAELEAASGRAHKGALPQ